MSLCITYLLLGFGLLGGAFGAFQLEGRLYNPWRDFGLGVVTNNNLLGVGLETTASDTTDDLVHSTLVANTFQLVLCMTYFLFNSLWSAQCAAKEWASFAREPRTLRVTLPRGQQRSRYYLSLPFRYAIPIAMSSGLLHFLISQSIFLARVQWFSPTAALLRRSMTDVAVSPLGILLTVITATLLLSVTAWHSFITIDNTMPVHNNLSAVMSAMCHSYQDLGDGYDDKPLPEEDTLRKELAEQPLMWGVTKPASGSPSGISADGVDSSLGVGHCTFTAHQVDRPVMGMRYI